MEKLSKRIRFGFGIGDLGGNLFFTIIGFYLLYYLTDVVHLSAALAGTVLMIGKIWDAVTDPLTGYLSDRTRSRWGRRRPYMFVGSLISVAAMILMFTNPGISSQQSLFWLMTFYFCLLNTAYTLVNIPYAALLPELTQDFDQRTVLTGYRMSFAVLGTFMGAAAVMPIISLFSSPGLGWSVMSGIMGGLMMGTAMVTIWAIREPKHTEKEKGPGFIKTYIEVLGLPVFLKALIPWSLFITGTTMIQGALVYFFKYIFLDENLFQIALLFLLTFSLIFIPIWVKISKKIGKKSCYNIGMGIMSIAVLLFVLLGEQLGPTYAFAVMALAGIGLSTHYVIPHAILPDVVEYDSIRNNGIRREGVFSSLWTFSSKIGQALALALNGWLLAIFKYDASIAPERITLTGIKIICGPIPVIFYISGIIILSFYPITRSYYEKMMAAAR
ncbi:MAG: MFS transporter [Spirochaetales bacterium]|nr:MFS transporter [Spirochaetales bacterium]